MAEVESFGGSLMNMMPSSSRLMVADSATDIAHQVEILRRRTQETADALGQMAQDQEAFALGYHECTKVTAHLQHLATQPPMQQNIELEKKLRR